MILIDTHALIWLDGGNPKLGGEARNAADEALTAAELWVSSITFCEVATLLRGGKIVLRPSVLAWRRDLLQRGLRERMIDGAVAIEAVMLDDLHRDPADRLIIATTRRLGARLLTADQRILNWPGELDRVDARL